MKCTMGCFFCVGEEKKEIQKKNTKIICYALRYTTKVMTINYVDICTKNRTGHFNEITDANYKTTLKRQHGVGPPQFPSNKIFPAFSEYHEVVESSSYT